MLDRKLLPRSIQDGGFTVLRDDDTPRDVRLPTETKGASSYCVASAVQKEHSGWPDTAYLVHYSAK